MMNPKSPNWLQHILEASELIQQAVSGRALPDYEKDRLLRSAVERNFEIIGEALNRIRQNDPALAARIPENRAIIGFRNLLIHGYDYIDHGRVWQVIHADLPKLRVRVGELLKEAGPPPEAEDDMESGH
jgi:uncharacterized protein with HEPN domain